MEIYNQKYLKDYRKHLRRNMTEPEMRIWYYLKSKNLKNYKFRRQFSVGNFILDFFCPKLKLAIEIDGDSHFANNQSIMFDRVREKFLRDKDIKLLRFSNSDALYNTDAVVESILRNLP